MAGSDKRKQSLYFPDEMLKEIQDEATRQDRSLSWIVQKAWKIARKEIMKYPSVNEFPGEEDEKEIIERVFHLSDRNITSLMTHRTDIAWFDGDETVQQVKDKLDTVIYSSYPVCEETVDNIKGTINVKDLLKAAPGALLKDIAKPAMFVPENNTAYQLLEKFKATKIHSCFIVFLGHLSSSN